MTAAISLTNIGLTLRPHFWSRPVPVLQDVSLALQPGEMCALIGANGAGKTTLLRILLGLTRPSCGSGALFGAPLGSVVSRQHLGFLPERPALSPTLTPYEAVQLAARLSHLPHRQARRATLHALDRLGMRYRCHVAMRHFSKGMLQRVGLAQALVARPRLLLLDEPLSGLDPPARRDVRALLEEERARGAAIFFATHILADVVTSCDRAAVLVAGRLRHHASPAELLRAAEARAVAEGRRLPFELWVRGASESSWAGELQSIEQVRPLGSEHRLRVAGLDAANRVVDAVRHAGGTVLSLAQDGQDLELLLHERPPAAVAALGGAAAAAAELGDRP